MYTILLLVFFSVWFISTVICQFRDTKAAKIIFSFDIFGSVPLWTFFAPSPGKSDYHLLYRDKDFSDERSEWKEIELSNARTIVSSFWNPEKRYKKVIADVVQSVILMSYRSASYQKSLPFTIPYLIMLNTITLFPCLQEETKGRQFLIAESSGFNPKYKPRPILLSNFHCLK